MRRLARAPRGSPGRRSGGPVRRTEARCVACDGTRRSAPRTRGSASGQGGGRCGPCSRGRAACRARRSRGSERGAGRGLRRGRSNRDGTTRQEGRGLRGGAVSMLSCIKIGLPRAALQPRGRAPRRSCRSLSGAPRPSNRVTEAPSVIVPTLRRQKQDLLRSSASAPGSTFSPPCKGQ